MWAMAGALVLAFSTRGVPAALLGVGTRQLLGAGGGGAAAGAQWRALLWITRGSSIGEEGLLSPLSSGRCTGSEVG